MTYKPLPFRDECTLIKKYEEDFCDRVGNKATITKCDFLNKKKKLIKGYTLYVKWGR